MTFCKERNHLFQSWGGEHNHLGRIRKELGAVLGMLSPSPQHLLTKENSMLPGIFSNDWLTS